MGKDLNPIQEISAWRYLHENPLATLGKIGQFQVTGFLQMFHYIFLLGS